MKSDSLERSQGSGVTPTYQSSAKRIPRPEKKALAAMSAAGGAIELLKAPQLPFATAECQLAGMRTE